MTGPVTYQLTEDDWADWIEQQVRNAPPTLMSYLVRSFCAGLMVPVLWNLVVRDWPLILKAVYFAFHLAVCATVFWYHHPRQRIRRARAQMRRSVTAMNESVTVSLTERGVLESDSVEERLTLYDAIVEATLTEKFLVSKDRRGGTLLVPIRAFGSEAAAEAFQLELDNRRLRRAVGLTVSAATTATPVAPAPETKPWWREPASEKDARRNRLT